MLNDTRLLDLIEQALDHDPTCALCTAPTDVRVRDGRLWLECSTTPIEAPTRLLERIGRALLPHPRRLVIDLFEDLAA